MSFLSLIPLRAWLIGGLALALAGLLWHDHIGWTKAKARKAQVEQLAATIKAERANRATEQADRRRADDSAKSLETELADLRRASKPVSVYCRPAHLPAASEGGTAASPSGAAAGPSAEEPLQDIGLALSDVWIEHASNAARARALIEWERDRTH